MVKLSMKKNLGYIKLTDANFEREVLKCKKPILVEITAEWSGCCHIMKPIIDKLAIDFEGKVKFGVVDIEENEKVAKNYGLSDLPIMLFFKNGELVDHIIGLIPQKDFVNRIKAHL